MEVSLEAERVRLEISIQIVFICSVKEKEERLILDREKWKYVIHGLQSDLS